MTTGRVCQVTYNCKLDLSGHIHFASSEIAQERSKFAARRTQTDESHVKHRQVALDNSIRKMELAQKRIFGAPA